MYFQICVSITTVTFGTFSLLAKKLHTLYVLVSPKSCVTLSPAAAAAKSLQSCPTLCNPIDGSPPGSPIPGILQARTLKWVAISFSNAWKWKVKVKLLSCVQLFTTPWTAAYQALPSMGFSRQEYWSGVPLPSPMTNLDSILESRDITSLTKLWFFQQLCVDVRVGPQRRLSTKELMLSNCGAGEDSWESLGQQGHQTSQS